MRKWPNRRRWEQEGSVGADVRKGGDRDPGRERERLPEHSTAGVQGRPGGERVVNQEDVGCRAWRICIVTCKGSLLVTGKGEGAADVGGLGRQRQADLGAGAARAAQDVRAELSSEDIRQLARDNLRLVVATLPPPRPVQRDGDDNIHVREVKRLDMTTRGMTETGRRKKTRGRMEEVKRLDMTTRGMTETRRKEMGQGEDRRGRGR